VNNGNTTYRDRSFQKIREWSRSADSTVAERIRERSLLLDDLEEYTNSSERSQIRSATVVSAVTSERQENFSFFF